MRLAHRQPAYRIAREINLQKLPCTLPPQIRKRRALHDPKLPLRQIAIPRRAFQKIIPRPPRPLRRSNYRRFCRLSRRRRLNALIEHHRNVRTQRQLDLRRLLRRQQMLRPVQMRSKSHTFVRDFAQLGKTEDLEPTGIREYRARPRHKAVQTAEPPDDFMSRPQI